jgi:hypothetical protein
LLFAFTIIAIMGGICNVTFSQGRRELGTYQNYNYELNDSIRKKLADSLGIAFDSTARLPVDSTARIKFFQYIPTFTYGTKIKPKTHPLLLENSSYVKKEVSFNEKNQIVIRETFNDEDIRAPLVMDLSSYLAIKEKENSAFVFGQLFDERYKGMTADELTQLFEKITDITIPLPFKTETIFGPPTFNLKINGAVDITASFQNINSEQASFINNNQSNINFKQEVQVNAKGTIGDKLTVEADWNTQRTFDFENQLKLKYTGYADEVIQKIEAGNVSLDTKSSLIQSTQALFGIKGEFKLGPLTLSSVVSQKKSKQEEKTFSQGVQEQNFQINVWDYSDNHYLFDTLYKKSFLEVYGDSTGTNQYSQDVQNNRIKYTDNTFEVWMQCDVTESKKRFAVGKVMLGARPPGGYDSTVTKPEVIIGEKFAGYFRKLESSEYYYNEYAGYINLKISVTNNIHVGVVYRNYLDSIYGKGEKECSSNENLILKLFKIDNQIPSISPLAWELKLKNIYRLPVSKILEDGFKLEVLYNNNNTYQPTVPNSLGNKSLAMITKIDRFTGKEYSPPPDGIFDFKVGKTINPETGDIIFPTLKPFYDEIRLNGGDSTIQFREIYTLSKTEVSQNPKASMFALSGSAKGEAGISNTFNLGLNVVLGSVQVLVGGAKLQENVDYSVDYTSGVVTIRSISALTAKDLKITYETNDLFTLASKTFIGLRGDYKINEKTNFGFTYVNLSQETLNDKVRIGEEPTNNSMFGLDFTSELKTNFVTKALNILPGYNTKEESSFSLRGEFAYLTPDPNTKKSQIPQDNSEAIAYIDDMEGAKKLISLGTSYQSWSIASLPIDTVLFSNDSLKVQDRRGLMKWYTVPNDVDVKDVYPLRDVQPGQDRLSPMYVSFDPGTRACYNYNAVNYDTVNKIDNWNGIMKYLNTTSSDLVAENINFIEFNMRIEKYGNYNIANGKLHIDLGIISEDAIPNGQFNTEDIIANGTLQESEDIGLDTLTDDQELAKFNQKNGTNYTMDEYFNKYGNRDPAGDNNTESTTINVDFINGTEKSRFTDGGQKPDSEDLDRTGQMEPTNKYYEYSVSLDPVNNKYISGEGAEGKGWFQYKIPLSEFKKNFHDASFRTVKFARIWITGVDGKVRIALIEFNLVGNQWYKPAKQDTTYNISVINIEENSQIYMSPVPGDVLRQTVRNTSGVNTKSNEQSLVLSFNNLTTGKQKLAVKDYRSQILDLFNYKVMKLFVNGDPSFNYTSETVYDAAMVIRFGNDSTNYYEYRAPIHPDIRPGQPWNSLNEVSIVFADLTALKITRDSVSQVVDIPVPNGPPGAYYRIRGSPALNSIREFTLGVEKNRTGQNTSISGSVWFNEVRVLKVNDDNGYAVNVNTSLKIADFGTATLNYSRTDPNFHALDQRMGTRTTGQNWDAGFSLNVHKILNNLLSSFLDGEWKDFLNIPVTYRHSENFVNPKYYPGTDIDLEKAAEEKYKQVLAQTNDVGLAEKSKNDVLTSAQTYAIRNDISVTGMGFKFPGGNYFNRVILNAFSLNYTGTFGSQRDFTYISKSDFATSGSLNYNTDFMISEKLNLNINEVFNLGEQYKDAKIYLFAPFIALIPAFSNGFSASIDFNRTRNESKQRLLDFDDPTGRLFKANRGFNFNWKFIENWIVDLTGTYSVKAGSDLTGLETNKDSARTQRSNSDILNDIFINEGLINFGNELDYQQSTAFNPKFNIPGINKFLDINMNYNVTYAWTNPNSTVFSGYNVGFANTFTTGATFKFNELLGIFGLNKSAGGYRKFSLGAASNYDDKPGFDEVMKIIGTFIPDLITVNFNQTNSVANPGVVGRPGFANFWVTLKQVEEYGPSRMYQLGFNMDPGKRVSGYSITDINNLANNVTFNTTLSPIIPQNIRMNLTFKKNWGKNNSGTYITQPDGSLGTPTNKNSTLTDGYSMFFAGNIDDFTFDASNDPDLNISNITSAFKSQIASFPFPNWSLTISGLEKLPLFSEFTQTVSFENSFTSEYSEGSFIDISDKEVIQRQSVVQTYNPLIGLNITFKQLAGGSLTASFRLNKSTSNLLTPSSNLVQVSKTNDWSFTANYAKSGFDIPMFGLALKNDITFSLTYSRNLNEPVDYKFSPETSTPEKIVGNGSTITSFNPSVSYSISSKVQLMVFYKYSKTEPLEGNANIPPRTSNEGGLNVRVLIQ